MEEVRLTREAIQAAELSLDANEKSFTGGVRSKLDVLNALEAVFNARDQHVNAQLGLGESLLQLQLTSAQDIDLVLRQVQAQVFAP